MAISVRYCAVLNFSSSVKTTICLHVDQDTTDRVITKEEELANITQLQPFSPARLLPDGKTVVKMGASTRETEVKTVKVHP